MKFYFFIFLFFSMAIWTPQGSRAESWTHLTIKEGLSQSSVKCLQQDYQGFIWAGTSDGLNKYDGSRFIVYRFNPLDSNSLEGNDISCIYECHYDSTLYIGTQNAGLAIYNRAFNNFFSFNKKEKHKPSPLPVHIKDIVATDDTTIWIATNDKGLFSYNRRDSVLMQVPFRNSKEFLQINCLETDNRNNLWIGTSGGLFLFGQNARKNKQDPEKVNYNPFFSHRITALKTDLRGNLWIGTQNNGLFKYQPITGELEAPPIPGISDHSNPMIINDIIQTKKGDMWIATNNGLLKFSEGLNSYEHFKNSSDPESLNNNNVYCVLEDQSGIIWAGTFIGGINKLDPLRYRFTKYTNFPSLSTRGKDNIHSVHVDQMSRVWLGTANGLIKMTSKGLWTGSPAYKAVSHLKNRYVGAISSTKNNLLISSSGILRVSFDGMIISNLSELIKQQTGEDINGFSSSFTDVRGTVWFTTTKGLLKYSPEKNSFSLFKPESPERTDNPVFFSSITEDYSGKLWLGTYSNQLYNFNVYTEKFELFIPRDTDMELVTFGQIYSVCESAPGQIFIGTNMGLYSVSPAERKLSRYLHHEGLPNNIVYAVVPDKQGKVWCSTNAGVACFNPDTKEFLSYTYEDGLQSNEFNEGAYFKDKNGFIYLAGIEGLNIFNPDNIRKNNFIPPVIITSMEIQYKKVTPQSFPQLLDKQISETEKIILGHKDNTFSFEFSALSYSLYNRNKYQFALTRAGEKDNWINARNRRTATFTNLSPGHYFFKVKGSNSDGVWNNTPATIEIIITPPFWQSWWFRAGAIILLIGLPLLAVFLRIRNIKMQRQNLKKLVKEKTKQIEIQNQKLIAINNNIRKKNQQLNNQHEQILNQRNTLLEMAEKTEAANQAKINLFTNISHELRTPLTLILSPLKELISKMEVTDKKEIKRILSNIHISASKLHAIINQLLEYRKATTGKMQLNVSKIDLIQFTQKTASLFNDLAKQKNFNFRISSSHKKLKIWVNPDKFEKILTNLLLNAIKYTPEGGAIDIEVSAVKYQNRAMAALIVRDTGTGIYKSELPHIFEQFYQSNQAEVSEQSGSGLGLYIVSKFVEMHKGNITVNSSFGEGSEFKVMLPFGRKHFDENVKFGAPVASDPGLLIATISNYIPASNRELPEFDLYKKTTLLLIEDDANLRLYLKESLAQKYIILEASSAKKGLELVKTKHADLVICDVFLPDTNGMGVCRKIKSDEKTCHLPVIMLTPAADLTIQSEGLKAGADSFISKPFDLHHLVITIENLVENRKKIRKKFSLKTSENDQLHKITAKDKRFLNDVVKCIEDNLTNSSFTVDYLCSTLSISQSNCYRKIKSLTGSNISEFIRNTRLKKASELLEKQNFKVNEVAYQTGFNDPNYFTKSFTKFYGITPTEYTNLL